MSNSNHVFVGLPALIKNAAPGDPIVSVGDNHVSGIGFFDAITGGTVNRDDLGINFRNTNFLAVVGTQVYFYTAAGVTDPDWTNGANWTELTNSDLTQALLDIQTNAGDIATNAGAISTAQSDISNNASSISTNASDISNNQNSISTNTTDIGQLQTDLAAETGARQTADSNLQSEIDAAELLISDNTADITTNASGISSNATAISTHVTSIDNHDDVDTSSTPPEIGQVLFWDGLDWIPEHPEVTVEVKNDTGVSLAKGTPVYVSGTHTSGKPLVKLADNDGAGTYPAIGLTYDTIAAGDEGLVVISGSIFGLNTLAYSAGDALYIDSTPGVLTNTRPSGHTKAVQKVALVKRSHGSAGSVIVMGAGRTNDVPNIQQNYFWLGDASGVATPTDFDTEVSANTDVSANTTKLAGIQAGATANPNAIDNVVEDTTPQLGGGLDLNGQDITGTGNINITGKVTQTATPTANQDLATKVYVDELIAAGIHYHDPVRVESPDSEGSLNGTYNNGTAGVGATLTNAGTQAALVIDGVTLAVSDRVLIYNQTDATENGIYTVTNTGSPTTNWVLTRATDADSYGLGNTELSEGTSVFVLEGNDGAGEVYGCTTTGTITFGTTDIDFSQIGASPVYSNATQTEDGFMSSADKTKLDGIAAGATANQTDAYLLDRANHTGTQTAATISNFDAAVSANSDVSANVTKLAGIEAGATADQTAGEIKTAYESNLNTNAFTDADVTKLGGIASGAEVNVNADWNAVGGDALILNKPALFDGSYNSLTNVPATFTPSAHTHTTGDITNFSSEVTAKITAADLQDLNNVTATPGNSEFLQWDNNTSTWVTAVPSGAANVQSDWNEANPASDAFILNKPTAVATLQNHFVSLELPAIYTHGGASVMDFNYTSRTKILNLASQTSLGSNISWANDTFTVSADGLYTFVATAHWNTIGIERAQPTFFFYVNGVEQAGAGASYLRNINDAFDESSNFTRTFSLSANDTVELYAENIGRTTPGTAIRARSMVFEVFMHEMIVTGVAGAGENNVQVDWTETNSASDAFILNKPTLSSVATGGASTDLTDSADLIRNTNTISDLTWFAPATTGQFAFYNGIGWQGASALSNFSVTGTAGSIPIVNQSSPTLTFTSADGSVTITGNNATNEVDFSASGGGGGGGSSNQRTLLVPTGNDYSGDVVTFGSNPTQTTLTVGMLYYYTTSGNWERAYGTSTTTSTGLLGFCVDASTPTYLVRGIIRNSAFATVYNIGRRLYVSTLQGGSGRVMDSVPSSPPSGSVIRAAGYVIDGLNGILMFDPSQDYITTT